MSYVLNEIEIENFKSYFGKHKLGPFMHFTAIVGPNGCGKSNLVEAISFVLGEKIANLRVREREELIFSSTENNKDSNCDSTCVSARLSGNDESLTFKRRLTKKEENFYLNSQQCSFKKYREILSNIGVTIKISNFMVLQGDVERILNENSKNMTYMFEKYSKSIKIKKKYDIAQVNLKNEMHSFTQMLKKKREAVTQKKNLDICKTEAGKYLEIKNKIKDKNKSMHLLKLKCIDIESRSLSEIVQNIEKDSKVLIEKLINLKNDQAEKKAKSAKFFRKITTMERQQSDAELEHQKIKPEHANLFSKIEFLKSKINQNNKSIDMIESQQNITRKRITELENSLNEARSLLKILDIPTNLQLNKLLTPEQYEEYLKLRDKADIKVQDDQNLIRKLFNERDLIFKQIEALNTSDLQSEKRLNMLKDSEINLLNRLDRIKISREKCHQLVKEKRDSFESISREIEEAKFKKNEFQDKLETLNGQLSNYKIDMRDLERQNQLNSVIDKLKTLFTGVHGKITELITPVNKRYHIAITKVLGRNIDAVVVYDKKIAFECIEYLKQQQIGRFIFLPLKSINPKPIIEKYRLLGGSSKLLFDTINFDPIYRNICVFIFGSTIVCDCIDESLRLSVGLGERRKTVCIDGTLFLKSGVISGGSRTLAHKAQRFNDKKIENLKSERHSIINLIQTQIDIINKHKILDSLDLELKSYNLNFDIYNLEITQLESSTAKLNTESIEIKNKLMNNSQIISKLQEELRLKNADIEELETKITNIKLKIFEKFIKKNKITNFEDFETGSLKNMRETMSRRITCQKHIDVLSNQLNYEKSLIFLNKKDSIQSFIEENLKEVANLTNQLNKLENELDFFSQRIESNRSEIKSLRNMYDKNNSEIRDLNHQINLLERQENSITQNLKFHEIKLEKLMNEKYELLKDCRAHDIKLIFPKNLKEFSELLSSSQNTPDVDKIIIYNSEKYTELFNVTIDFSQIEKEFDNNDIDDLRENIQNIHLNIDSLKIDLDKAQRPNLKILNDYDKQVDDVNKISTDFIEAKNRVKTAQNEFNELKIERKQLFMRGFNLVSNQIDKIYKSMCNDNSAQAFLSIEDSDEPYLGGISYSCVPPNKGFQSIQKLSGGEKSLAALSLLFSLQTIEPAPFVILDEVDAALDSENIKNLANYIRNISRMDIPYFVISLKEDMICKANALIGITSTPNTEIQMSKIFTLNLDRYSAD